MFQFVLGFELSYSIEHRTRRKNNALFPEKGYRDIKRNYVYSSPSNSILCPIVNGAQHRKWGEQFATERCIDIKIHFVHSLLCNSNSVEVIERNVSTFLFLLGQNDQIQWRFYQLFFSLLCSAQSSESQTDWNLSLLTIFTQFPSAHTNYSVSDS